MNTAEQENGTREQALLEEREGPLAEPLLDAAAAGRLLGVKPSWVYEAVRDGRSPHVKVGRHIRFLRSDLEAWVLSRRVEGRIGPRMRNRV